MQKKNIMLKNELFEEVSADELVNTQGGGVEGVVEAVKNFVWDLFMNSNSTEIKN